MGDQIGGINSFKYSYRSTRDKLVKDGKANPTTKQIITELMKNKQAQKNDSVQSYFVKQDPTTKYMPPIIPDTTAQTKYMPPVPTKPQTKYMPPVEQQDTTAQTKYMPPVQNKPQAKYMPPVEQQDSTVQTKYMPPISSEPQTKYMPPVKE